MGKQSGFLQRERQHRKLLMEINQHVERQRCMDCFQIALRRKGYSYNKIKELTDLWMQTVEEFAGAFHGGKNPEADYLRVKMDEALAEFIAPHQEFVPFPKRYPDLREIRPDGTLGD